MNAEIREPVSVSDIRLSTEHVVNALSGQTVEDWDGKPTGMDWTRRHTLGHLVYGFAWYATILANRDQIKSKPSFFSVVQLEVNESLRLLSLNAELLACVFNGSPTDARGWHPWGSPDPEGYLAMGCNEVLLHGHDVLRGLSVSISPPEDLCDRILRRLFPWSPLDTPRWETLLWITGRGGLENRELITNWKALVNPLDEWDGRAMSQ